VAIKHTFFPVFSRWRVIIPIVKGDVVGKLSISLYSRLVGLMILTGFIGLMVLVGSF
jgi:hypothetical protein